MFRPVDDGGKRADFLVNLTNDGWFKANRERGSSSGGEFSQHRKPGVDCPEREHGNQRVY